jgi:hypothetical protein
VEGTHADDDFISRSCLAYEASELVDVADTNGARSAGRVRRTAIAGCVTHDDSGDGSVMQHPEICSVASLLIEAVIT